MQQGKRAGGGDFEHGAETVRPAQRSSSVEKSVTAQHESGQRLLAVGAVRLRAEAPQGGEGAAGGEFEDRAYRCRIAAVERGAVQGSVAGLEQAFRINPVGATALQAELIDGSQCARWGQLEDRAVVALPTGGGSAVEVAVDALDQRSVGPRAIGAILRRAKAVQGSQSAAGSDLARPCRRCRARRHRRWCRRNFRRSPATIRRWDRTRQHSFAASRNCTGW